MNIDAKDKELMLPSLQGSSDMPVGLPRLSHHLDEEITAFNLPFRHLQFLELLQELLVHNLAWQQGVPG